MVLRNLALIGTGRWGQVYLKTLAEMDIHVTTAGRNDWVETIDERPDGIIVCTPPESHVEIAEYALSRDIPVMIEKPLSLSVEESLRLTKFNVPILVNHIDLFTETFERIKLITQDCHVFQTNVNLYSYGPFRSYSGLWDYGPHAIAIILALHDAYPENISATTLPLESEDPRAQLFNITLNFPNAKGHCLVGNGGATKQRAYSVKSNGMTIMVDDMKRLDHHQQPLNRAIQVFLNGMDGKDDWRLGLDLPIRVIKVLEACQSAT